MIRKKSNVYIINKWHILKERRVEAGRLQEVYVCTL